MKKLINQFLTLLLVLIVQFSFAQEKTISGTITDETGMPLPGVNIVIKNTNKGTQTDFDGNYSVEAQTGDVLVFSYVSYETIEKTVGEANTISVSLKPGVEAIEEVIVVGYGNKTRDVLTSGVSTVTTKELAQVSSTTNIANALQGKAAGVVVTAANGKPGNNAFVRIRGISSVNASSEPLYVVDGIPVGESDLNLINNSDIESISVLKDAASASAYGSRASNGVVLITTKSGGKNQDAKIAINTQIGWSEKVKDNFTMMNARQKLEYERYVGDPSNPGANIPTKSEWDRLISYDHDWQKDLLKKGFIRSNGISISGGGEKTKYFISYKNEEDTGIVQNLDGFKRSTARVNLGFDAKDWISINLTSGVSHTNSNEPRDRDNVQNPFSAIYSYNPYSPMYQLDADGNPLLDENGEPLYNLTRFGFSITEALKNNPEYEERLRFISTLSADFKFFKNLTYTPQVGLTYSTLRREYYIQPGSVLDGYIGDIAAPGLKTDNGNNFYSYNFLNKLNYNTTFKDIHSVNVTVLSEFFNNNRRFYFLSSKGYADPDLTTQDNSAKATVATTSRDERALFSIGALVDYNFKEKYVFSASIRRDGSSMFGQNKKYGMFWSGSAAWNLHKEKFLENSTFVNSLKLRASYGTLGNDRLPSRYGSLGLFSFSNYNGATAAYKSNVSNPELQWESKGTFDLGVDFSLFNRRLRGVVNYFNSSVTDLLFAEALAAETGEPGRDDRIYPLKFVNFGSTKSSGLELELNGDVFQTENFTWTLGGNIAFVKSIVNSIPRGEYFTPNYNLILRDGEKLYTHYLVRYAGVNPKNGKAQYYTKNGEITEKYNGDDAVALDDKTVAPDFDGNIANTLRYKTLSLSANFYYKYGNYIYNNQEAKRLTDGRGLTANQDVRAFNYWKKEGDTDVLPDPRKSDTEQVSDRFLQDGSYIRLRSLRLGYELPKKLLPEKSHIKSISLYGQAQNLWTYAPYFKGDPEVGIGSEEAEGGNPTNVGFVPGAYNLNSYPTTKSYIFGIDLTF